MRKLLVSRVSVGKEGGLAVADCCLVATHGVCKMKRTKRMVHWSGQIDQGHRTTQPVLKKMVEEASNLDWHPVFGREFKGIGGTVPEDGVAFFLYRCKEKWKIILTAAVNEGLRGSLITLQYVLLLFACDRAPSELGRARDVYAQRQLVTALRPGIHDRRAESTIVSFSCSTDLCLLIDWEKKVFELRQARMPCNSTLSKCTPRACTTKPAAAVHHVQLPALS